VSEKRKGDRVPLDIYLNKFVAGVPYLAKAWDISAEGVSLAHLIEPQNPVRRVGLQFQLPGSDEVIYAEGEVVRQWGDARRPKSGVRFTRLTERHRQMIHAFVHDQLVTH